MEDIIALDLFTEVLLVAKVPSPTTWPADASIAVVAVEGMEGEAHEQSGLKSGIVRTIVCNNKDVKAI